MTAFEDVEVVGLDADNTLWHSEVHFVATHERVADLLTAYVTRDELVSRLAEVEAANRAVYGYGVKDFTLSLIETAVAVSDGRVTGAEVAAIVQAGKELLRHPVDLLPGVGEALDRLADRRLVLVTKGDLLHQETKLAASGLEGRFERIVIVSEKDEAAYRRLVVELGVPAERFCMIGDSLRSDVAPAVAAGALAIHVPHDLVASLELHDGPLPEHGWATAADLVEAAGLLVGGGLW